MRYKKYTGDIAVYKNDEIIAIGTAKECAEQLGVSVEYIKWMTTPFGRKRAASRKNPDKATTAIRIDEYERGDKNEVSKV